MKQNKKIAITGGIGSGKSTVLRYIAQRGYPVFSCDQVYADLIEDKSFLKVLSDNFGNILDASGRLDRKKLSAVVFGNPEKVRKLNELTHPAIYREMFRRAEEEGGLCFCEVPLLFESNSESLFNGVIVVLRDEEERIKSIALRDNLSNEDIKRRISNQFDYNNGNFEKYYVIHNTGSFDELYGQIDKLLLKLEKK